METVKKIIAVALAAYVIYFYFAVTTPEPDKPVQTYEPWQTQQIMRTQPSTDYQIKELEDRMDLMAERYQRDLQCIKSGSSFC